jgi:hypothetical protein
VIEEKLDGRIHRSLLTLSQASQFAYERSLSHLEFRDML